MPLTEILDKEKDLGPFFGVDCESSEARLLWRIQKFVESEARVFVRHGITQATYVEFQRKIGIESGDVTSDQYELIGDRVYSGCESNYGEYLQLDNGFVRSVQSVYEDHNAEFGQGPNDFGSGSLITAGVDYVMELDRSGLCKSGRLIRIGRSWSSKPGTIKISYTAGFTQQELDDQYSFVKMALIMEIQKRFNVARSQIRSAFGPVKKITYYGDYQEEYAVDAKTMQRTGLSFETMSALQPIKSMVL